MKKYVWITLFLWGIVLNVGYSLSPCPGMERKWDHPGGRSPHLHEQVSLENIQGRWGAGENTFKHETIETVEFDLDPRSIKEVDDTLSWSINESACFLFSGTMHLQSKVIRGSLFFGDRETHYELSPFVILKENVAFDPVMVIWRERKLTRHPIQFMAGFEKKKDKIKITGLGERDQMIFFNRL